MIWEAKKFAKKVKLDKLLCNYSDIYLIQSEAAEHTCYGYEKQTFAIIRPIGMLTCSLQDVPAAAQELKKPIRDEVLSVYTDICSLGLERVW